MSNGHTSKRIRLGINVDHVATLRNARGGLAPCPIRAAEVALDAGVDGITVHLREDRRHISETDVWAIKALCGNKVRPLNLEVAATAEAMDFAIELKPTHVCIVPEKRAELTTEDGLKVAADTDKLSTFCKRLRAEGIKSTLFIDPHGEAVHASHAVGADAIELHTGAFCQALHDGRDAQARLHLDALRSAAEQAHLLGLDVHAGHGIDFQSAPYIASLPHLQEVNIGHFLIGEAVFTGLPAAVTKMRWLLNQPQQTAPGNLALKRNRALYRARYRGFREADAILGTFAAAKLGTMGEAEIEAFEDLLERDDHTLYQLFVQDDLDQARDSISLVLEIKAHIRAHTATTA